VGCWGGWEGRFELVGIQETAVRWTMSEMAMLRQIMILANHEMATHNPVSGISGGAAVDRTFSVVSVAQSGAALYSVSDYSRPFLQR
jgi:hypothetical protein